MWGLDWAEGLFHRQRVIDLLACVCTCVVVTGLDRFSGAQGAHTVIRPAWARLAPHPCCVCVRVCVQVAGVGTLVGGGWVGLNEGGVTTHRPSDSTTAGNWLRRLYFLPPHSGLSVGLHNLHAHHHPPLWPPPKIQRGWGGTDQHHQ